MKSEIVEAARKRILYLPHAIQQMSRPDRMISTSEVEETIWHGEVIEEYPNDPRGQSCLVLHFPNGRCVHIVCAPKLEYLAIITAYLPDKDQWSDDFRSRIR
jgi:hypothetical protein